jgi:hypothetical protein
MEVMFGAMMNLGVTNERWCDALMCDLLWYEFHSRCSIQYLLLFDNYDNTLKEVGKQWFRRMKCFGWGCRDD